MHPNLLALIAIALWSTLAILGVSLAHVPPFLLTGVTLLIGALVALPLLWQSTAKRAGFFDWQALRISPQVLALGIYGLFGFHFLLFIALRHAPPVQANLVNYLWPLGIVVMAPLFIPGVRLSATYLIAACVGFMGACIAIAGENLLSQGLTEFLGNAHVSGAMMGYLAALCSAFIWASYSLVTKRLADIGRGFPTAAIGVFGLASGVLSLLCHTLLETPATLSARDWLLITLMGLGPLGAAFYLWDAALKKGHAQHIGLLSYLTPLASTALLMVFTGKPFTPSIALATALIVGAALLGARAK